MLGPAWNKVSAWGSLRGPWATSAVDPDAAAYASRVVADGGTVEDIGFLSDFFQDAKANNYYSDIVAAYSPSWGVKGTTTASKLYCINGATTDLVQTTGADQPAIALSDLNGRTRLDFDGSNDFMVTGAVVVASPETIIMMGVTQESWTLNDRLFDGLAASEPTIVQSAVTPDITINGVATNSNLVVGSAAHLRCLAGVAEAVQVDNNAETTGSSGQIDFSGFTLGSARGGAFSWADFSGGAFVVLNSAEDANYDAKMAAIYAFSKSAYGTP